MKGLWLVLILNIFCLSNRLIAVSEVIETPAITFEGNNVFTSNELFRALFRQYAVELNAGFGITEVDDAAYFLEEFYYSRGFPKAKVTYLFHPMGPSAVFQIVEGEQVFIRAINFKGNTLIDADRLRKLVTSQVRIASKSPWGRLKYLDSAIANAQSAIRAAYTSLGYLDASITYEKHVVSPQRVDLSFHIAEGPLFTVEKVDLIQAELYQSNLSKIVNRYIGKPYTPDEEVEMNTQILNYLREHGYYEARVSTYITFNKETGSTSIQFYINKGTLFYINSINVIGYQKTNPHQILKRLRINPGSTYNNAQLDSGVSRLWFSGAFADVTAHAKKVGSDKLDIEIKATEKPAQQIQTTVGYGQWNRAFGEISYLDRNFLGTLNRLSINTIASFRTLGAQLQLSDPFLFKTDTTGTMGSFFLRQELPSYKTTSFGGELGIQRQFVPTNLTGYQVQYQWKGVTDTELFADVAGSPSNYILGIFLLSQTLDRRDEAGAPTEGYLVSYDAGVASRALLGELNFLKLVGQATYYFPFMRKTPERPFVPFLVLNHKAGLIVPFADTNEIPVPERFFLGGPNSVRSFQIDGMPPRDRNGVPVGGLAYLLFNAEVELPLWNALFGAFFIDAGNLSPSVERFEWEDTRVGVGTGLRLYTPLGILRMDYGYNLIRREGDPIGAWQFGFGLTF